MNGEKTSSRQATVQTITGTQRLKHHPPSSTETSGSQPVSVTNVPPGKDSWAWNPHSTSTSNIFAISLTKIKRVLKKTGTCWVNLGDTYAGSWGNYAPNGVKNVQRPRTKEGQRWSRPAYTDSRFRPPSSEFQSVQPKSLCQIPSRFAIEMANRGWILRNELIWWKPNCMPSSAKDRFTVDFEKMFFFSKNKKYYFETQYESWTDTRKADIQRAQHSHEGYNGKYNKGYNAEYRNLLGGQGIKGQPVGNPIKGRHKRSVWQIPTQPFPEAHFAVYPEALIETPIKAGCPEVVCKRCGKPQRKNH